MTASTLRDRIADVLQTVMHEQGDPDIAQHFTDSVMSVVGPVVDGQADAIAAALVLAAGVDPRYLRRARRGEHRRMYVPADRLIVLIDALDERYPGLIAKIRDAAQAVPR